MRTFLLYCYYGISHKLNNVIIIRQYKTFRVLRSRPQKRRFFNTQIDEYKGYIRCFTRI